MKSFERQALGIRRPTGASTILISALPQCLSMLLRRDMRMCFSSCSLGLCMVTSQFVNHGLFVCRTTIRMYCVKHILGPLSDKIYVQILAWLALAIGTTSAQYLRGTSVEINNGVRTAWWSPKVGASSTSISTMHPAPTLWYNCRYAKSICNNVEKTQPGANAGTLQMELVYDSDTKRRDTRRSGGEGQPGMCPGTWKNTHTCPEPDQPDVWVIDMQRDRQLRPVKIPNSLKYPSGMYNGKANTQIADFARRPSGLMYTCDEFPFASTIQGGTGFIGDANAGLGYASTTYCAPQRSACGRNEEWMNRWRLDNSGLAAQFDKLVKKTSRSTAKRQFRRTGLLRDPESDQDAQGHALSLLTVSVAHAHGSIFDVLLTMTRKLFRQRPDFMRTSLEQRTPTKTTPRDT